MSVLAETNKVTLDEALPCCDGDGACDGESLLRLGVSFTTGDLSLLSFSIPADQWKRPPLDQTKTKSIRVWYVVVATEGEGNGRLLTGILTGEARHTLSRHMEAENIEQMEPINFAPHHVCGGIEVIGHKNRAEEVSEEHCALCRCDASKNKPFCDGSHSDVKFKDDK